MKYIYLAFLFLFIAEGSLAQSQFPGDIDSLSQKLSTDLSDSSRLMVSEALAHAYLWTDNDSALYFSKKTMHLANKLDNKIEEAWGGIWKFTAEGLKRQDTQAIKTYFYTKELAQDIQEDTLKTFLTIYAGILYLQLKEYQKSLDILLADTSLYGGPFGGVNEVIAEVYYKYNKPDSAIKYIKKAIRFYKKQHYEWNALPRVLGNSYRIKGAFDLALQELHKALYRAHMDNIRSDIIVANVSLAQTFFAMKNYDSSLYYSEAALHSAGFNTFPDQQAQTYRLLMDLYKIRNNPDSAYKYTALTLQLKDSIYAAEKIRAVQRAQLEQQMKMLQIEKERTAYQNRVKVYALIAIVLVILLIAVLLYNNNRRKQQTNQNLQAAQRKLLQSEHKLKEMDHLKSRFFANISHEFRTPLTLLIGPLEDLMKGGSVEAFKDILPDMYRNSQRLLQLINQLLDLSRLDAGKYRIHTVSEPVIPFVKQIVHSFSSLADAKDIDLETDVDPDLRRDLDQGSLTFYFDRDIVEKILTNLLSNAFKFTSPGGHIIVTLGLPEEETGFMALRVEDNGEGIPADKLPYIFDRFYQAENSGKRVAGSGIGLALIKELIELHGGKISVSSEQGKGSCFSCLLPLNKRIASEQDKSADNQAVTAPNDVAQTVEDQDSQPAENEHKELPLVLVAEDQRDVRKYICSNLKGQYKTIEVTDGTDGLKTAMDHIPDLVISDVMMPEMNGFELCAALKTDKRTSHIPVILLTARAEDRDKIAGLETGADAYLIKPFNSRELLIRVKNLIGLRNKMRAKFSGRLVVKPTEITVTSQDRKFMQKLLETVEAHMDDAEFSVEALGKEVNMSVSQINRKLKALINQPASQFIRSVRLERAMELLKKNTGTVSEVAFQTGFENPSYFTKVFKKQFGCLPSEKEEFPE